MKRRKKKVDVCVLATPFHRICDALFLFEALLCFFVRFNCLRFERPCKGHFIDLKESAVYTETKENKMQKQLKRNLNFYFLRAIIISALVFVCTFSNFALFFLFKMGKRNEMHKFHSVIFIVDHCAVVIIHFFNYISLFLFHVSKQIHRNGIAIKYRHGSSLPLSNSNCPQCRILSVFLPKMVHNFHV